tara:strand:- start:1502 stop:2806 length:1305 start_codon:yes stop_codon:yes gene_type:complete
MDELKRKKINVILKRDTIIEKIKNDIIEFDKHKDKIITKRGFFIYGDPGTGKTTFVNEVLNELNYDIISYNACDVRNKSIMDIFTKQNMSDTNVLSLFYKKKQNIAIIMDEIDGMNNGDKGGITSLIKLVRPKKTKKQKLENYTANPIFCIGNYHMDKKIKELLKVSNAYELKKPTHSQMEEIVREVFEDIDEDSFKIALKVVNQDLKKLTNFYKLYLSNNNIFNELGEFIVQKSYNENVKMTVQHLFNNKISLNNHLSIINETDRTIIGLLWHENIVDVLNKYNIDTTDFYLQILNNFCFADYIDRITFQKQIWQFNEMSSLIKTMFNNHLYNNEFEKKINYNPSNEVRFTKVLTKYSTEFNNSIFICDLCQKLNIDSKDLLTLFYELKLTGKTDEDLIYIFENYDISKLDINRMIKLIEKYTDEIEDNLENE